MFRPLELVSLICSGGFQPPRIPMLTAAGSRRYVYTKCALIALLCLIGFLSCAAPAQAQFYLKVPFVRVQTGGPDGGVYVKAPLVTVDVPPKPGYYLVPVLAEPTVPPPPFVVPAAPAYVIPAQPPAIVIPAPAPVVPAPVVVVPKKGPLTIHEFAKFFVPTPGKHDVLLIHPGTGGVVEVAFVLPPGVPKVITLPRSVIFAYGPNEVEIHFGIKGKVKVLYR